MFRKLSIIIVFCGFFALVFSSNINRVHSNSFQPPLGRTGGPGELTCAASGCHAGTVNSGTGQLSIEIEGNAETYLADEIYDVTITIDDPTKVRFGFEMMALNEAGESTGVLFFDTDLNTIVRTENGRVYIHHFSITNPNENTFSFQWVAPESDEGTITFYAAGLAANGNGNANGDLCYTTTTSLSYEVLGIRDAANDIGIDAVKVGPNPFSTELSVQFDAISSQDVSVKLFNAAGQLMYANPVKSTLIGANRFDLNLHNLPLDAGMYFVTIEGQNGKVSKKVIKQ